MITDLVRRFIGSCGLSRCSADLLLLRYGVGLSLHLLCSSCLGLSIVAIAKECIGSLRGDSSLLRHLFLFFDLSRGFNFSSTQVLVLYSRNESHESANFSFPLHLVVNRDGDTHRRLCNAIETSKNASLIIRNR